ncbi:phage head closure protein [Cytobacillus praedii]|uniref:Phage head-tail adapter protein n=1 Tax=Cytobacillus praedii TaxID=1742358 RepID=A0A4R1AV11_9BACI|nr:phage head closure protein [Cytobacillus praedii]TCJ01579.1 phage head-tail adapter protein [Cytobacillus praedii]
MNDILFFPIISTVEDDLGQIEEIETYSDQIFSEKKPIAQTEFFQAGQSGIKPSCLLVVSVFDYSNQEKLMYNDKIYSIYRTYERTDEKVELYCEVRAG